MNKLIFFILMLAVYTHAEAQHTVGQMLPDIQRQYNIHFVYDADIHLDIPCTVRPHKRQSLKETLDQMFKNTTITYVILGKNIILKTGTDKEKNAIVHLYGRVLNMEGEPIIRATVTDSGSQEETLSDEHGRYSLFLKKGRHTICAFSSDTYAIEEELTLQNDTLADLRLMKTIHLKDIKIAARAKSSVQPPQTGFRTYDAKDLETGYALLSTPDLIKTLQNNAGNDQKVKVAFAMVIFGNASTKSTQPQNFNVTSTPNCSGRAVCA